jgi:hypothetical protein
MSWWIWAIIIVIALIILVSLFSGEESSPSNKNAKGSANNKSVKNIADEVTTIAQFRALERKVERADEKRQQSQAYDSRSLKAEERADEKYQVLQDAFDMVSNKVFRWQFIPNADLETPLEIAKNAYKVFPATEYEERILELGNNKDWWYGLRGDEESDEKDEEIKFIIKFRTIVEHPELSDNEISKKINSLVSRNVDSASNFFDTESDLKPAEQWREISA